MALNLVYPALAQIFWTFVVLLIMFMRRRRSLMAREVRMGDVAVATDAYPQDARLAAANYSNQFESPVLFFALIMLAMEVGATGYIMTVLAWIYVATRIVHTVIHIGKNYLPHRASVFFVGMLCLFAMFVGVLLTVL